MAIALSIKPHKYKCDLMLNWEEFFFKIPGFMHKGDLPESLIAIPEICPQLIHDDFNLTNEIFIYAPDLLFSNVQYKKDLYSLGDFVRVGMGGNSTSCCQKIVMIRKFYILPSGKKVKMLSKRLL